LLVGSVMAASLENELNPANIPTAFPDEMERLSVTAHVAYRTLVEDADFVAYFQATSPIDVIGQLNIGSRPAKRKPSARLEDLRAIPWVFSWTQNRHLISGWHGAGTALAEAIDDPGRLSLLRRMYRDWRFFRNLTLSLGTSLLTADMTVARWYAELAPTPDVRDRIFGCIEAEHARTVAAILAVTDTQNLDELLPDAALASAQREQALQQAHRRQVDLLRRVRAGTATDDEKTNLLLSINCIAAGLRNTG
jgi:phosphoenolpyruvate carboxylase